VPGFGEGNVGGGGGGGGGGSTFFILNKLQGWCSEREGRFFLH